MSQPFLKNPGKTVLVLDNHQAHRAFITTGFINQETRLTTLFLPAYSSDLNPIERVWSKLK